MPDSPTKPEVFTTAQTEIEDPKSVLAVSIKLPQFWESSPVAWFIQIETQFKLSNISQDKKMFQHVILALPKETIVSVLDVIENPPATDLYGTLKRTLIERFSLSDEKKLDRLLADTEMGDRKPSDFYRELNQLAGSSGIFNQALLLKLWMKRLPNHINGILVSLQKDDPSQLTPIADKIWETMNHSQIHAVRSNPKPLTNFTENKPSVQDSTLSQLCTAIAELSSRFNMVEQELAEIRSNKFKPRGRSNNRSYSRDRSRSRSGRNYRYCYYHYKFRENAHKCAGNCKYEEDKLNPKNPQTPALPRQ